MVERVTALPEGQQTIELIVRCDCGFEARGSEAVLVPVIQRHGRDAHDMDVTREQALAMARPV